MNVPSSDAAAEWMFSFWRKGAIAAGAWLAVALPIALIWMAIR